MNKTEIRKLVAKTRNNSLDDNINNLSHKVFNNLINSELFINQIDKCKVVFMYASYNHEASTNEFFWFFKSKGYAIGFPRITDSKERKMSFFKVDELSELSVGYKGILEPISNVCLDELVNKAIMLVPVVGFDTLCNRVGYGGGYYDRYISSMTPQYKVGIGFEFQKFNKVDSDELDIKLDYIVTEKQIYGGSYERNWFRTVRKK